MNALSIKNLGLDVPTMQFLHNNKSITRPITDHPPMIQNTFWGAIATINILHPSSPFAPPAKIDGIERLPANGKVQMELMAEYIFKMFSQGVVMLALQEVPNPNATDPAIAANFGFLRDKLKSLVSTSRLIDVDALTSQWLKTGDHRFGTSILFNPNVFKIDNAAQHDLNYRAARYVFSAIGTQHTIQVANVHGDFTKQEDTKNYIAHFKGFCMGDLNISQPNVQSKDNKTLLSITQPVVLIENRMCHIDTYDGIQDSLSRTIDPNFTPDNKIIVVTFQQRKNTMQYRFLEELNKLCTTVENEYRNNSADLNSAKQLRSILYGEQQQFFAELTPQSTAETIKENLNNFRKRCENNMTEINKIVGVSWLYRVVEILVKAVAGLLVGVGMTVAALGCQGLANEEHRKRYKETFFRLEQTKSTQAVTEFKSAIFGDHDQDNGVLDEDMLVSVAK